jgi:transposase
MFYGFDVHKNFIQVCELSADAKRRRDFRIEASAEAIEAFAKTLQRADAVVLEATFHTWAIHSILSRYVERVAVANPIQVKAIAHAKIKTDKVDAHTLAQLLRTEFLPEVQLPSRKAWALRQLMAHRRQLLKRSTASKNAIHGVLNRSLVRYPERWLFTQKGFRWLKKLELPAVERLVLDHQIGLFHEIQARLKAVDQELLRHARLERDAKLLVTIPGVDVTVAIGLLAAIDSIERFASPQKLAAYFGLVPKVRQSAGTCHHGRITKAGSRSARWLAIEAAHTLARSSSPLAASYHRIRRRKNHQIAVTALAMRRIRGLAPS